MIKSVHLKIIKVIKLLLVPVAILIGLRSCYYGSPFRSCIYTEKEIPLSDFIANSKISLIKPAEIIRGIDKQYHCLDEMGQITNKIVAANEGKDYRYQIINPQINSINPSSNFEMTPIKLISVTKHGISTIDSGPGPIVHLIMKNQAGEVFEVAIVSLGINKGDEFLKAVNGHKEIILNPDIKFSK